MVSLVLLFDIAGAVQGQNGLPTPTPKWMVKLNTYGWHAPPTVSNKAFFKDFTLSKLEALDSNTRICFIGNDVVVAYHTKEGGQDWRTASRQLEAFFISAKDGRLLDKKEWPTVVRGSESDLRDSESRLIPLSDGRFLVFANRTMMLYSSNLEMLRQKQLEPSTPSDLWSAQSVSGGNKIFLRHQSSSEQQTTYFWLSPETLLPLSQMSGFRGKNFSAVATAGDDFVLAGLGYSEHGMTTGIGEIDLDESTRIVCSNEICREATPSVLSSCCIAFSARHGIGIVDRKQGLVWSLSIPVTSNPNDFQFGGIETAMSGNRFAVWVTADPKTLFDGVKLSSSPTLLLYATTNPHHLLAIPIDPQTGDFDFALSPDGSEVAIFDGARIRLYSVN
jgi:hypothetical protein